MASLVHETGTRRARLLIGGQWVEGDGATPVLDKFLGTVIGEVAHAGREQVAQAVAAAKRSFENTPLEPYERYRLLLRPDRRREARFHSFGAIATAVEERIRAELAAMAAFISGSAVTVQRIDRMTPLTERRAGSVRKPLHDR